MPPWFTQWINEPLAFHHQIIKFCLIPSRCEVLFPLWSLREESGWLVHMCINTYRSWHKFKDIMTIYHANDWHTMICKILFYYQLIPSKLLLDFFRPPSFFPFLFTMEVYIFLKIFCNNTSQIPLWLLYSCMYAFLYLM